VIGLPKCEERVSIGRIEEYLERKRWEYLTASKKQRGRILDEVCGALHYHRKAAARKLSHHRGNGGARSHRRLPRGRGLLAEPDSRRG
jgi:hypothetical protein